MVTCIASWAMMKSIVIKISARTAANGARLIDVASANRIFVMEHETVRMDRMNKTASMLFSIFFIPGVDEGYG
jgi:hypothetical protein